jgi:hypothetical protein
MKDQTSPPTALKTSNAVDALAVPYDFHADPSGSREKLDWSPSSPTSCQDSVDLNDADSDSSPVSVDSQVVLNTFNSPQDSDSDDCDSLDLQDWHKSDVEFNSWTLASPKRTFKASNDGQLLITQVPLKNRTLVANEENDDDILRDISFPPKKRQKIMLSMLSHSKKLFGESNAIDDNDIKLTKLKCTKISFNETVDVLSIPTRFEYSPEMRSKLWSSIHEINENAARNTIEFASEGWDWRNVTLDSDMYRCPATGQFIHPVHCYNRNHQ